MRPQFGTYYRWTRARVGRALRADILGADVDITADPDAGTVTAQIPARPMDPDTARMIGVRLIEGASLADASRCVKELEASR